MEGSVVNMYIKKNRRSYYQLETNKTVSENFYDILRAAFPTKNIKRHEQKKSNKYDNSLKWSYFQYWFKGLLDEEGNLYQIKITGCGLENDMINRFVKIKDGTIDISELRSKFQVINRFLKNDAAHHKKITQHKRNLDNIRKEAKISPQDSKIEVDFEDIESEKYELCFHFLNEWEVKTIIKFQQSLHSEDFKLVLIPSDHFPLDLPENTIK